MSRTARTLAIASVALLAHTSAVSAAAAPRLDNALTATWTTVFETPSAQNPFGTGGLTFACLDLGSVVAPFAPEPVQSCTVPTGTSLFVIGNSFECSTFEGNGTTEEELRTCARQHDLHTAPSIALDGETVSVAEVETPLVGAVLPADNIFGLPARTEGQFVAHGWVALLHPLTPGQHDVTIEAGNLTIETSISVKPPAL